jgi:hypothetical protein
VFFGGALATEIELAMEPHEPVLIPDLREEGPKLASGSKN